jgi:predicted PurR-regulated permease PerM
MTEKHPSSYLILPVWIFTTLLMCAALEKASDIVLWIACAFFLCCLLDPGQKRLQKLMPKSLAALLLVVGAMLIATVFLYFIVHFSAQMVAELETSKKMFLDYYRKLRTTYESWMQVFSPPGHTAHAHVADAAQTASGAPPAPAPAPAAAAPPAPSGAGGSPMGGELASTLAHTLGSFFTILVYAFLIPVLTFFFLTERTHFGSTIQLAMSKPERGPQMWDRIVEATVAYFFGNLLLGVVSFPILVGLFFAFGVPSPITLAALASVFNLIPFLGAVLSGFLPAVALLSGGAPMTTVIVLYGLCAMFHMILANFVTPKVLGQRLNVNATTSTLALVILGDLCGGVGLLLAIPFVATIKIMFETSDIWWLNWIAGLMNEKPAKPALEPISQRT